MCSLSGYPRCRCFFIRAGEMCHCRSEWVPSEWESDKNITIIHSPSDYPSESMDYCDVFIRLSFWRHPFTSAETHLMKKQAHPNLGWTHVQHILCTNDSFKWVIHAETHTLSWFTHLHVITKHSFPLDHERKVFYDAFAERRRVLLNVVSVFHVRK